MDKYEDLQEKLFEKLNDGFQEHALATARGQLGSLYEDLQTSMETYLKEELAMHLSGFVQDMAERAVVSILQGNDEQLRLRLQCREGHWTGRDREHPVIHGELFEQGAILIRKQIVEAHAELLKSERIKDLEDQVKSLVGQLNKGEAERMRIVESWNAERRRRCEE